MKIAVCEDQLSDQIMLRRSMGEAFGRFGVEFAADFFGSGRELLSKIKGGNRYDLVILDIFFPEENGMDTAMEIRRMSDIPIAFVTSSKDYALTAYDVDPVHYLVKPVNGADMEELLKRLFKRKGEPVKKLVFKSARMEFEFPLMHVREIISRDKGVEILFRRGGERRWLPFPFREAEWVQDEPGFVKINRGHLVNLDEVIDIDYDICRMKDGSSSVISRRERQKVRKKYNSHLFHKMDG